MTTLRATTALAYDLLNEGYEYVLTSKFQSDPLERRYGNLRSIRPMTFNFLIFPIILIFSTQI